MLLALLYITKPLPDTEHRELQLALHLNICLKIADGALAQLGGSIGRCSVDGHSVENDLESEDSTKPFRGVIQIPNGESNTMSNKENCTN